MEYLSLANHNIATYDKRETSALQDTAIYLARCFAPSTFAAFNFATRVSTSSELWKYFDSQQEFRVPHYYNNVLKGLLHEHEISLFREIGLVYGEIYKEFSRVTNPVGLNHLISSIPTLRLLSLLSENHTKKLKILEIGGGSGMLGHMCASLGHTYTDFDITQSFAVHKITINQLLYGKNFFDFGDITGTQGPMALQEKEEKVNFLPWWKFTDLSQTLPSYDVVVMNHCFFEISKKAMTFLLSRLSHQKMERVKLIVSEWGATAHTELTEGTAVALEKDYDFKKEAFAGDSVANPDGTVLLSFKRKAPFSADYSRLSVEDRIGFSSLISPSHRKTTLADSIRGKIGRSIRRMRGDDQVPLVLGDRTPLRTDSPEASLSPQNLGSTKLLELVGFFEEHFGKPIYTEDELAGYFMASSDHA